MSTRYVFMVTLAAFGFCSTGATKPETSPAQTDPEPEFCRRGFQLSSKYYTCWKDATYEHRYTALDHAAHVYTSEVLEKYALHMCSVVKPAALKCFAQEIAECANVEILYKMADSSGGTCMKNALNPAFKSHIIDHLKPVPSDSPCFALADDARLKCYDVGNEIPPGASSVDIKHFSQMANKLFSYIWECHVDMFRSATDQCPDWQMPMLFSLQQTAMPSLFGMHLNNHQVAMLQLGGTSGSGGTSGENRVVDVPEPDDEDSCPGGGSGEKTLLLMRVIEDRTEADREGDVVIELGNGVDGPRLTAGEDTSEAVSFFKGVINARGGINMRLVREKAKEIRKKMKERKKGEKEIKQFLINIQNVDEQKEKVKEEKKLS